MELSAAKIAKLVNGAIVGNPDVLVSKPAKIEDADSTSVSFLANPKYEQYAATTKAGVLIVNESFQYTDDINATLVLVKDAYAAFTKILELFARGKFDKKGVEEKAYVATSAKLGNEVYVAGFAYVSERAKIGNNVKILPHVFIGEDAIIGDNTIIHSGVNIYHDCVVGNNCILHAGVVIGSDGFGFAPLEDGSYQKIPQLGNVVIEDCVEIGANTVIDRATMGSTIIRKGVKLDNQIQVAHNVEIGENTVIAAQTGIAGSTKIGKNCMIGGQVGIAGHLTIADGVKIGAKAGILSSVESNEEILLGAPAFGLNDFKKSYVVFRNLPDIAKRVKNLEKEINKPK